MADPVVATLIAFASIFGLIALHVPIGAAMALVGVVGFGAMIGWGAAFSLLATEPASIMGNIDLAVIPLFLLMGNLAVSSGLARDLYTAAYAVIGHKRGGLALATFIGAAGFGSICGSAVATTVTFGRVALPEMLDRGYAKSFSAGIVAAGGTLGIVVPPSTILIIYAILTEQFILDLFAAAVIPSILALALYLLTVSILVKRNPSLAPAGPRATTRERLRAIGAAWGTFLLAGLVLGGIYAGVFTVTEGAAVGVTTAFVLSLLRGLKWEDLKNVLISTATASLMVYMMIFGASIFGYFLTITRTPEMMVDLIISLGLPPLGVIGCIVVFYLFAGAIFDEVAAIVLTLPFVAPVVAGLGYDLVWWGIINVMVVTVGMISPPIGLNVFVLNGLRPDLDLKTIYKGVLPFMAIDIVRLAILVLFPALTLWLPTLLH